MPTFIPGGDRPLPHDHTIEKKAIGAALFDNYAASVVVFAIKETNGQLFHHPISIKVGQIIAQCYDENISISGDTIYGESRKRTDIEHSSLAEYVADCMALATSAVNIDYHIEKLLDLAVRRFAAMSGFQLSELAFDGEQSRQNIVDTIIDMKTFCSISVASNIHPASSAMARYEELCRLEKTNASAGGFSHMLPDLANYIPKFKKKELHIIAARPSIGKTALMTELVLRGCVTKGRQSALVISIEMSSEQIMARMISQATGLSEQFIKNGNLNQQQLDDVALAKQLICESKIVIADPPSASIYDICCMAKREMANNSIDSIWIDYLQLVSGDKELQREREVAEISSKLKELARQLDVPVIALAQLRRFNSAEPPIPTLDHLRESGAIEQDADSVTLIHRQRYLKDEDKKKGIFTLDAQLFVAKHRNGNTGIAEVKYHPSSTRFMSEMDTMQVSARLPYKDEEDF